MYRASLAIARRADARLVVRLCIASTIALAGLNPHSATAQDRNGGGFFQGGGLGGLLDGDGPGKPGPYSSPSASDIIPQAADVGAPPIRSLRSFEPIALPNRPDGAPVAPKIDLPGLPAYAPQSVPNQNLFRSNATLSLSARLSEEGEPIPNGLIWRLFAAVPSLDGRPSLVASSERAAPDFEVPAGSYILHVGFGRAGTVKRIDFPGVKTRETITLDAGGLKLNAVVGDDEKPAASRLTFDIYTDAKAEADRQLVASDVPPEKVVRLNSGTYHVVSNYGSVNALVRAEIRVEAGKLTEATLTHRAALLTMKLVREHGGEAIADTAWTITTASGDLVRESVGAFPSMVLAEGDYVIVAKNNDRVYQRGFKVEAGEDTDVEVLTSDLISTPDQFGGSGD
ncbi:hypothetical protein [Jiella marina]|uniref:hypothetical protein n=1 Tax=Jiella sp. LLJ827 TaxID=2917712 RepID=UPI002100C05F|nr:hypothetical protein [Jiella sp. LLJ827]MCQ0990097.1 hypothetical protein [Jiella sp. LLJ827]